MNKKHKKNLRGSLFLSICLHAAALVFLQRQSLWLATSPAAQAAQRSDSWISSMKKKEGDEILKEAFQAPSASSSSLSSAQGAQTPSPQSEESGKLHLKREPLPFEMTAKTLESPVPPPSFPESELLSPHHILSFTLPPEERTNLFALLPKNLIVPTPSSPQIVSPLSPPPLLSTPIVFESSPPAKPPAAPAVAQSELPPIPAILPERSSQPASPLFIPTPNLPKLPTLGDLSTVSCSDAFETDLIFLPQEDGGAIFALTLIPHADLDLTPIRQNYFFLIDRSNSIQKDRLLATKNAVQKAIEELEEGDTFNIFAFDNRVEKLSPISLPLNQDTLKRAKAFLDKLELGSFFSQADLFKPLFLTIPSASAEDELYTAIVMTDGESMIQKGISHSLLGDWTRYNDGRVSLFVVGLNSDGHLPTLETSCAFNRGKLFSAPTKRGIKRKLLKAMKTIHAPLAKNLSCRAISRSPHGSLEIFPKSSQAPHLYLNEPYVIIGRTDTLEDFIFFVQGRLNGEWLHIKKSISFLNGKKGGSSLKAEWAQHKAYELYNHYLLDDNPKHLAEARVLLAPHELRTPFE